MNKLCLAVALGFFAVVVEGCGMTTPSPKSCDFSHNRGNKGNILDENGKYIKDAHLAWIDVAKNCFPYVTDPIGTEALSTWINASKRFNIAMLKQDENEVFKLFHVCNDSFKVVAPYIDKCELAMYFLTVYIEFGALIETKNFEDINNYMVAAFPKFKEKLGC